MTTIPIRYPMQPHGVAWPIDDWEVEKPTSEVRATGASDPESRIMRSSIDESLSALFDQGGDHRVDSASGRGTSLALLVVHRGRIIAERYGRQPANDFHDERTITADTPLISWSMAKSITHAMVGMLVADRKIVLDEPLPIPEWRHDGRSEITWSHLLQMRDGLDFIEDYTVDAEGNSRSDVIGMLFGSGADDVFEYARSRPQSNSPGEVWSYSSGTTNIVCGLIGRVLGGRRAVEEFMNERLFSPLGMSSAVATFDEAGTFIGSSYVHATARDFARFGYLYVRGGIFAGYRVLDEQWVNSAHRQHAVDPDNGHGYGEHWWTWNADERTLAALGYEGQRLVVVPDRDLVLVHLGKWDIATQPHLDSILTQIIESVPLDGVEQPT